MITMYCSRAYLRGKKTVTRMLGRRELVNFHLFCSLFLVVVVLAFFFCWTPFHAQRLMFVLGKNFGINPEKLLYRAVSGVIYSKHKITMEEN